MKSYIRHITCLCSAAGCSAPAAGPGRPSRPADGQGCHSLVETDASVFRLPMLASVVLVEVSEPGAWEANGHTVARRCFTVQSRICCAWTSVDCACCTDAVVVAPRTTGAWRVRANIIAAAITRCAPDDHEVWAGRGVDWGTSDTCVARLSPAGTLCPVDS